MKNENSKDEITIIYSKLDIPLNFTPSYFLFKLISEEKFSKNKLFGEKFV